ncbi:DUF4352 domain-containing protein [Clostridium felsineum]|uniref:Uncharacterized protein n=1 Tax=Clostridium felsineum TaxID=36839 RepID=A0A1S8MDW6_9CLOT|nr:DUF4352 domain-containing protein [Clostridium felsineum]URZ06512.1 hypothetical protein CLROS_018450 [Clostridium felsineum]URZ11547.1 hypothetical protein CROST_022640 [Clostridium felsineum]
MNKPIKIILGFVVIVVVLFLGIAIGSSGNSNTKETATKTQNKPTQNTSASNKEDSNKKNSKTYKLGQEGQINDWSIKVLDVQETNKIETGDDKPITTQQKFVKIKVQMTNKAQSPKQYSSGNFMLGNMKDKKTYQLNSDAGLKLNEVETIDNNNSGFFLMYDDLNPNTPKQTYLVFEVPTSFNVADGVLIAGDNTNTAGYYLK